MAQPKKKLLRDRPRLRLYRNDSVEFEDTPPLLRRLPFVGPSLGDFIYPDVAARQACYWGGFVFGVIGVLESLYPTFGGPHSSQYHGLYYLLCSGLLLLPAVSATPRWLAHTVGAFGGFFAMMGIFGFLLGSPPELLLNPELGDRFHWPLLPGILELGLKDHLLQEVIGVVLLLSGIRSQKKRDFGSGLEIDFK